MLLRKGKAKLKNYRRRDNRMEWACYWVRGGNHLITDGKEQTLLLTKMSYSTNTDIKVLVTVLDDKQPNYKDF